MLDVLERIGDALPDVEHALVLGNGSEVLGRTGAPRASFDTLARALAGALTSEALTGRDSARCILNVADACVFLYVLGADLTAVVVGPPNWNVALTGRVVEPLLADFVDSYLAETTARHDGAPSQGRGRHRSGLALRARRPSEREAASPDLPPGAAQPELVRDLDVLGSVLAGLVNL